MGRLRWGQCLGRLRGVWGWLGGVSVPGMGISGSGCCRVSVTGSVLPRGGAGQGAGVRCGGARGTRGQCPGSLSGDAAGVTTGNQQLECWEGALRGERAAASRGTRVTDGTVQECGAWTGRALGWVGRAGVRRVGGRDYRTWNGAWQSDEVRVSWAGLWDTRGSVPGPEERCREEGWETRVP